MHYNLNQVVPGDFLALHDSIEHLQVLLLVHSKPLQVSVHSNSRIL